jgi:hypothetical protein
MLLQNEKYGLVLLRYIIFLELEIGKELLKGENKEYE